MSCACHNKEDTCNGEKIYKLKDQGYRDNQILSFLWIKVDFYDFSSSIEIIKSININEKVKN